MESMKVYFCQKNIGPLFEALLAGVAVNQPADVVDYLKKCLSEIHDGPKSATTTTATTTAITTSTINNNNTNNNNNNNTIGISAGIDPAYANSRNSSSVGAGNEKTSGDISGSGLEGTGGGDNSNDSDDDDISNITWDRFIRGIGGDRKTQRKKTGGCGGGGRGGDDDVGGSGGDDNDGGKLLRRESSVKREGYIDRLIEEVLMKSMEQLRAEAGGDLGGDLDEGGDIEDDIKRSNGDDAGLGHSYP
ncbi:hypothetical protein HELRODRAFT_179978 [Helobdella robusta]|uniref:Uncharacterized protein n=1 Tax=Helobdella robusta TaxID=6412 RepID=T1FFB0_HELRO|nr:hypothetical protein HELRODRAFT_179978 [Helobdella robusta]ESN94878.1 hypothetical protein HELRODRAFT_179978 [Helobdella robusta]